MQLVVGDLEPVAVELGEGDAQVLAALDRTDLDAGRRRLGP